MKFENPDNLEKVYVTSVRNNTTKYLEAKWNESTQSFVTEGHFDESDLSYVPGTLSVEYTMPRDVDYSIKDLQDEYNQIVSENMDIFSKIPVSQKALSDGTIEYTINVGEESSLTDLGTDLYKMTVKEISKTGEEDWFAYAAGAADIYTYFFDQDGEKYYLNLDFSDPKEWVMIIDDVSSNKFVEIGLEAISDNIKNPILGTNFDSAVGLLSCFGHIKDMMDISEDYDELVNNIYLSGLSGEEQAEALRKAKELKQDREMYLLLTLVITCATAGTGSLPFALLMGTMGTMSDFFFQHRAAGILQGNYSAQVNWCIDPSGYVYEGVTSNRIENVKTTVYCIPYDENDPDFWDDPKTENAIIWNAAEYNQENPLFTDENGCYAWDVPEGWWQVKFEKDGYETTYSEWLPVPPPQTEVNIGLTSTTTATVENIEVKDGSFVITFSQYINPETITGIVLKDSKGNEVDYTIEYSKDETDTEGNVFAKVFTLKVATGTNVAEIEVPDTITNYAGKTISPYKESFSGVLQPIRYQTRNGSDLRLIAFVDDLTAYSKVAFTLTIDGKESKQLVCTTAYAGLLANGVLKTTTDVYGVEGYFVAFTINGYMNYYAGKEVTITVTYTTVTGEIITDARTVTIGEDKEENKIGNLTYANVYDWTGTTSQVYVFASATETTPSSLTGQGSGFMGWWHNFIFEYNEASGKWKVVSVNWADGNNEGESTTLGANRIVVMYHDGLATSREDDYNFYKENMVVGAEFYLSVDVTTLQSAIGELTDVTLSTKSIED